MPAIINADGSSTFIPEDPANHDYKRYLADTKKTDEQVKAEVKAERDAVEAAQRAERNRDRALRKSARDKLFDLGLTRAELRALLNADD